MRNVGSLNRLVQSLLVVWYLSGITKTMQTAACRSRSNLTHIYFTPFDLNFSKSVKKNIYIFQYHAELHTWKGYNIQKFDILLFMENTLCLSSDSKTAKTDRYRRIIRGLVQLVLVASVVILKLNVKSFCRLSTATAGRDVARSKHTLISTNPCIHMEKWHICRHT